MNTSAADDVKAIRHTMEYERGFAACMGGSIREVPPGCSDATAWLAGWDEAYRLKPKT